MIKLVKRGFIIEPITYKNWIIEIIDDTQNTGGYYLLRYSKNKSEGFDDWFLTEEQVHQQIAFEKLIVEWENLLE